MGLLKKITKQASNRQAKTDLEGTIRFLDYVKSKPFSKRLKIALLILLKRL